MLNTPVSEDAQKAIEDYGTNPFLDNLITGELFVYAAREGIIESILAI